MDHVFTCLHCNEEFVVPYVEFNCRILRHGVYKHNLQPINPHASREECEALRSGYSIYGCAGPLKIIMDDKGGYSVIICDYI